MKKIILSVVFVLLLVLSSCSDEKTKSGTTDSQAIQTEMTNAMEGFVSSPGMTAMNNNMAALDYLPFGMPVKSLASSLDGVSSALKSENVNLLKKVFKVSAENPKQDDHFVISDHYGTYTCTGITTRTDEYGEVYVAGSTWDQNLGGTNITVIIPASIALDGKEFKLVLHDYQDELISWYEWYDGYEYYYDDYFPKLIDMEVLSAGNIVLDLYFTGSWQYLAAVEDIMPVELQVTLDMTPYSMQITFTNSPSNVMNYDMTLKENNVTMMSMDAMITFTDATLEEVSEVDLGYGFGDYYIDFWANVTGMEAMDSGEYTLEEQVEILNSGDYIWCYIKENDVQIGRLMAKMVWDEYEWNEEDQDYTGAYVIVPYILFNDGSMMDEDTLAALFGGFEDVVK